MAMRRWHNAMATGGALESAPPMTQHPPDLARAPGVPYPPPLLHAPRLDLPLLPGQRKRQPVPAGGAAGVKFHGRSSSRRSMVWPRARRSSAAAM